MYELHQHCFKPRMDTYKNLKNQNWLLNLKQPLKESYPATLPPTKRKQMSIVIDFIGNVGKDPIKKQILETFHDLVQSLWSTFKNPSTTHARADIVFDLYRQNSIKLRVSSSQ